jgi:hypothetical protein
VSTEHVYHDRDDELAHCKVCNGAEGSLPTDCPGTPMTPEQEDKVYGCELDFRNGEWVVLDPAEVKS